MIGATLSFLREELNDHLKARFDTESDQIRLAPVVEPDGETPPELANGLAMTLINLQHEPVARHTIGASNESGQTLQLLISANFPNRYLDGVAQLSEVMNFFRNRPLFDRQSAPALPDAIERLSVEWQDMDTAATSQLWLALGARYRPSMVYRVRMLVGDIGDAIGRG